MIFDTAFGRAALAAGLLLTTSPFALADEAATPQSTGADAPAARSALPGGGHPADEAVLDRLRKAKPLPPPRTPERGAAHAGDRGARAMDFGTVTRRLGRNGETTTTGPGAEIERSLKQEDPPPPPPDAKPERGGVESAPVAPPGSKAERKVFGPDDRVPITFTREYPFRAIGLLEIKFPGAGDERYLCSGTLIGQRNVLTAAHCLYDIERRQWPEEVLFFPGLDGDDAPFGYFTADQVDVLAGYVNAPTRVYDWQHILHDMGLVRLTAKAGAELGTLGYGYNDGLPPFTGNIVGYPMDMPLGTMWRSSCGIDTRDGYPSIFETRCDTFQGSSGSGIYDFDPETTDRVVYGVNVAENPHYNAGVRITGPYFQWIQRTAR